MNDSTSLTVWFSAMNFWTFEAVHFQGPFYYMSQINDCIHNVYIFCS